MKRMSKITNIFTDEQKTEVSDYTFPSADNRPKKLLVTVDASHAGYKNKNGFWYDPKSMKYAVGQDAWTKPFPKPFLKNHDLESEPIGRVQAARFIDTQDGKGYTQLDIQVTDSDAIEKIVDGRYLTVSTHGVPMASADPSYNFVLCSVCDTNLNTEEFCGHSRGHVYEDDNGQDVQCFWRVGALDYKEVSIVNNPADNDGATAAQISGVSMLDGEDPIQLSVTDDTTSNKGMLVFSDSAVTYAADLEFKEAEIANLVLWESVGHDKQQYMENKGLLFNCCDDLEDDSKAGYPPNCNKGYSAKTVKGTKKCVATSGKSKAKSGKAKTKNYDAKQDIQAQEASIENFLIKAIEKFANEFNNEDKHEENKMNLKEETTNRLKKVLEGASDEKIEAFKLLISSNDTANDELKAAFLGAFEGTVESEETIDSEETKEVSPEDLADVMTVEGVKEYLELIRQEAHAQGYEEASLASAISVDPEDLTESKEAEESAEEDSKEDTEEKTKEESDEKDDSEEDKEEKTKADNAPDNKKEVRDILIDSIVKHASALRKPEIDLERVEASQKEYKETLAEKSEEDLKDLYKELSEDMIHSFMNTPSEKLNEGTRTDDKPSGETENTEPKTDAQKIMASYFGNN